MVFLFLQSFSLVPSDSQLRTALAIVLRGDVDRGWWNHYGLKCASWTAVNSGTSGRSPCSSIGNIGHASVREANCLGSRIFESNDHQNGSFHGYLNKSGIYGDENGISQNMIPGTEDVPIDDGGNMSQCHIHIGTTFLQLL